MGAQDVEAVRRFYASWTNADLPGMLDVTDPAIDAVPVLGLLHKRRSYRGHDGFSQWFEEVKDLWEGFEVHVERTAEIDGAVVAFLHLVAHQGGRASDARIGVICRMRDHKIVSITGRDADEIAEEPPGGAITCLPLFSVHRAGRAQRVKSRCDEGPAGRTRPRGRYLGFRHNAAISAAKAIKTAWRDGYTRPRSPSPTPVRSVRLTLRSVA